MKIKTGNIVFLLLSFLLLGYTAYRAYVLSFTIDEATSYIYYALDSYKNIIKELNLDANNHILNSVCMKFFSSWLPLSEFTLRLQSIIAHILFLTFTWAIIRDIKPFLLRLSAFILLNCNPYLLDFFSLARGYALSWGLMAGSIYFFKLYFEKGKKRILNVSLSFLFAGLAIMASFVIINYYWALLMFFFAYNILDKRIKGKDYSLNNFILSVIPVTFISIPALGYAIDALLKLKSNHFLFLGGEEGFMENTVIGAFDFLVYPFQSGHWTDLVLTGFCTVIFIAAFFLAIRHFKAFLATSGHLFFPFVTLLLALIILIIITQHHFLGVRYVVDRAAMYLFVIFLFITTYLGGYLAGKYKYGKMLLYLAAGVSAVQFVLSVNITHVYQWEYQADVKQAMHDLPAIVDTISAKDKKTVILPHWSYFSSVKFYQYLYHYQWLDVDEMNTLDFTQELYYFPQKHLKIFKGHPVTILETYPISHSCLLKNDALIKPTLLEDSTEALKDESTGQKTTVNQWATVKPGIFSKAIVFDVRKYRGLTNMKVIAESLVNFIDGEKSGQFVESITDSSGKTIQWHARDYIAYPYFFKDGWAKTPFPFGIERIPPNADKLKIFIWNTGNKTILVKEIKAELLEVKDGYRP